MALSKDVAILRWRVISSGDQQYNLPHQGAFSGPGLLTKPLPEIAPDLQFRPDGSGDHFRITWCDSVSYSAEMWNSTAWWDTLGCTKRCDLPFGFWSCKLTWCHLLLYVFISGWFYVKNKLILYCGKVILLFWSKKEGKITIKNEILIGAPDSRHVSHCCMQISTTVCVQRLICHGV